MSTYLITGGAGFIGSHLAEALLKQGERVRIFDNFSTGKFQNIDEVKSSIEEIANLEVLRGDIRSYHLVQEAVQGVDYILHQGAIPSVPHSVQDPITVNEVNVTGTLNLLQAARQAGVKRLVFASSCANYGDEPTLPKVETMPPRPMSPYSVSKLTGEQYCQAFWQLYGFETVCLRYFNVFGARQDPTSQYSAVIPKFITTALRGEGLTIFGDGEQSRDFVYVNNVVRGNLLACIAPQAVGQVINIACGNRYSLLDLVTNLQDLLGKDIFIAHAAAQPGDVKHSQADITKAKQTLEYEPVVDFREGLRQTVAYYQNWI